MRTLLRTAVSLGSGTLLAGLAVISPQSALAEVIVQAQGRCKMMFAGSEVFNGHCTFKHSRAAQGNHAFVVHLDDGKNFRFTGPNPQALNVHTHSGIRNANHSVQGDHETFAWNDGKQHKLSIKLDQVQNPQAKFESSPEKVDNATLLGTAVGALIGSLITGKPVASSEPSTVGAPVGELQSLVGVKGGSAERELTAKGYSYRGGTKLADSSFTYWQQPTTANCVAVRTTDGRYQSITYTDKTRCN